MDAAPSIRPTLRQRARPLLPFAVTVVAGVAALWTWSWWRHRARAARRADIEAIDREDAALVRALRDRLAPLRRADVMAAPAGACPPDVTGPLALVEKPVLDWMIDGGSAAPPAATLALRSPVFQHLSGSWIVSADGIEERHAAITALAEARFVAVSTAVITPVTTTGEHSFEGGGAEGEIAIGDLARGQFVCRYHVASQPTAVFSVRALGTPGNPVADERDAIERAYREDANAGLALVAPAATLLLPDR